MRLAAAVAAVALAAVALAGEAPEGLELDLQILTQGPVQPGERIDTKVTLVNRSKTASHRVVRPGDGSDVGWREPHVFWSATLTGADGVERKVDPAPSHRVGLFAAEWWNDVTTLKPRDTTAIDSMVPAQEAFDVQEDGKLRLVAHYAWKGGREARADPMSGGGSGPADLGGMKGVEPFELASKPVEIEVRRSFDVVAVAKGSFKAGLVTPLSQVVDVRVLSRSAAALPFEPTEWEVTLANDPNGLPSPEQDLVGPKKPETDKPFELAAGATVPLLRDSPLGAGRDISLRFTGPGKARIAVVLHRLSGAGPSIRSNWIEVTVEK